MMVLPESQSDLHREKKVSIWSAEDLVRKVLSESNTTTL